MAPPEIFPPGVYQVQLSDPLFEPSFIEPSAMLAILLEVQAAGQTIPVEFLPTEGSDPKLLSDESIRALKLLANSTSAAFLGRTLSSRGSGFFKAEARRLEVHRKHVQGVLAALRSYDAALLHPSFSKFNAAFFIALKESNPTFYADLVVTDDEVSGSQVVHFLEKAR